MSIIGNVTVSCPSRLALRYHELGLTDREFILLLQLQTHNPKQIAEVLGYTNTAPITNMLKSMEDKGFITVERGQNVNVDNLYGRLYMDAVESEFVVTPKKKKPAKKKDNTHYVVAGDLQNAGFYPQMNINGLASIVKRLLKEYESIAILAAGVTGNQLQKELLPQDEKPENVIRGILALALMLPTYEDLLNYVQYAYNARTSWLKAKGYMVTRPRLAKMVLPENVQQWLDQGKPVDANNTTGFKKKKKDFSDI